MKRYVFARTFTTVVLCIAGLCLGIAQDAVFSQYYGNPLRVNPAFAGRSYGATFVAQYRNQWPSIAANYQTFGVAYDQHLGEGNDAIAIQAGRDDAGGFFSTTSFTAMYSYKLSVDDDQYFKIGLETGLINTALNWDKFIFEDQVDPQFGVLPGGATIPSSEMRPDVLSNTSLDLSAGIVYFRQGLFASLSAKHLTGNGQSVSDNIENQSIEVPTRFNAMIGGEIMIDAGNKTTFPTLLQPTALFTLQGPFWQLNAGANVDFGKFFVGAHYRHAEVNADAVIAAFGVRNERYKLSYSFDYTVSNLGIQTGGSHEILVSYNLDHLVDRPSRYNDCLKLFR